MLQTFHALVIRALSMSRLSHFHGIECRSQYNGWWDRGGVRLTCDFVIDGLMACGTHTFLSLQNNQFIFASFYVIHSLALSLSHQPKNRNIYTSLVFAKVQSKHWKLSNNILFIMRTMKTQQTRDAHAFCKKDTSILVIYTFYEKFRRFFFVDLNFIRC